MPLSMGQGDAECIRNNFLAEYDICWAYTDVQGDCVAVNGKSYNNVWSLKSCKQVWIS